MSQLLIYQRVRLCANLFWSDLVVEIKGYRREDAKEKKATIETYWVPGVNNLGQYGRWAFAEFTEVYQIEADFAKKVEAKFNNVMSQTVSRKMEGKAVHV